MKFIVQKEHRNFIFNTNACSLLRGWAFCMIDISQARFDNPKEAPSTVESLLSPKFQIERLKRDKSIANPCPAEEDALRFLVQDTFGGQSGSWHYRWT